jgi:hypothetical protein
MFQILIGPAIVFAIVARIVYNIYRPGLSNIPGPFLCKITDAYRAYRVWRGDAHEWFQQLREEYGPLVRIGPNMIFDCEHGDPHKVLGFKGDYKKVRYRAIMKSWGGELTV